MLVSSFHTKFGKGHKQIMIVLLTLYLSQAEHGVLSGVCRGRLREGGEVRQGRLGRRHQAGRAQVSPGPRIRPPPPDLRLESQRQGMDEL